MTVPSLTAMRSMVSPTVKRSLSVSKAGLLMAIHCYVSLRPVITPCLRDHSPSGLSWGLRLLVYSCWGAVLASGATTRPYRDSRIALHVAFSFR